MVEVVIKLKIMKEQLFDNLFNADHRTAMLTKYGYTEAMALSVDDVMWYYLTNFAE
jgi:hypothetical protein